MNVNRFVHVAPTSPMRKSSTPMTNPFSTPLTGFLSPARSRPDTLPSLQKSSSADDMWSPSSVSSNCSSDDNNSPTALNTYNWDKPTLEKTVDFSWTSPHEDEEFQRNKRPLFEGYVNERPVGDEKKDANDKLSTSYEKASVQHSPKKSCLHRKTPPPSSERVDPTPMDSACSPCDPLMDPVVDIVMAKEPEVADTKVTENPAKSESAYPPHRNDSLPCRMLKDEEELRNAAWFQAGIPREIALEVLSAEPVGSFIVRESTTKPGCYALSLRVPPGRHPSGIAHYLIMQTSKGYKIKGFTKEFSTLSALITHHSVMPELLPCPLSLSRYTSSSTRRRRDAERHFIHTDQHCQLFSDIQRLMADLDL